MFPLREDMADLVDDAEAPVAELDDVRSSSFDTATWLFHRIGLPASAQ